ncbi:hypothetical protein QT196_18270 [Streptomyces sp. P9-2B-2]|nr:MULTISPECIES: hypothetical protein [Streptomyces]MCX4639927.1 hypothetical protein [Streptomyces platensis]WJY39075.1 hypothetical protein QT196_18270 [Streptomyces sp. P9-2B-2]
MDARRVVRAGGAREALVSVVIVGGLLLAGWVCFLLLLTFGRAAL